VPSATYTFCDSSQHARLLTCNYREAAGAWFAGITYLDIVLQVVVCALPAAQQVTRVEGVVHVPANAAGGARQVAHTKLLALKQRSMEIAQRKDDGAELRLRSAKRTTRVEKRQHRVTARHLSM
jgi:hypothetical protein